MGEKRIIREFVEQRFKEVKEEKKEKEEEPKKEELEEENLEEEVTKEESFDKFMNFVTGRKQSSIESEFRGSQIEQELENVPGRIAEDKGDDFLSENNSGKYETNSMTTTGTLGFERDREKKDFIGSAPREVWRNEDEEKYKNPEIEERREEEARGPFRRRTNW